MTLVNEEVFNSLISIPVYLHDIPELAHSNLYSNVVRTHCTTKYLARPLGFWGVSEHTGMHARTAKTGLPLRSGFV
jgi:hypothetical protein